MKTIYFPSLPAVVPAGSTVRTNPLGLLKNLSRTVEDAGEKLVQRVADPAHPFHLLKAIMITQTAGFTSVLAACLSSLTAGLGHGYIAGTTEKKKGRAEDTFGLVIKALNQGPEGQTTDPISFEELKQLKEAAIKGEIGPLTRLIELIEKEGDHRAVSAAHEVMESGEGFIKEAARDELEEAEPGELMKKALAGDSEALSAMIFMVHFAKNQKARESLSSHYAGLAERASINEEREGRTNEALLKLKEMIFKDPDAIPWMGKAAEEGNPAAWEALGEAMKNGPTRIANQAISTMREIPISKLVDRVRDNLYPYASDVQQTTNILKMLIIDVGRLAAMLELEMWPNRHAEVTLRDLTYNKNISGAKEAYQRWLQNHRPQPAEEPLVIESTIPPKKPRRDSTEVGIPTHTRPPKPAPPKKKK